MTRWSASGSVRAEGSTGRSHSGLSLTFHAPRRETNSAGLPGSADGEMLPDALPVFSSVSHGMLKSSLSSDGSNPIYIKARSGQGRETERSRNSTGVCVFHCLIQSAASKMTLRVGQVQ